MKPSIVYILKVCLATLLTAVPLTTAIGFTYIGLITLVKPTNYIFTFIIPFSHVLIFVGIIAVLISLNMYLTEKMGYKRFINDRAIVHSIVIFILYLIVSKNIFSMDFDYILFSYVPMFITAYIFSKIFSSPGKRSVWTPLNKRCDDELKF